MTKLILHPDYQLYEQKGKPFCDSLQVAESFDKRHADVLRDIENTIALLNESDERKFALINFEFVHYKDSRKRLQPKCLLSKDGFTYQTMGYGGKKCHSSSCRINRTQHQ